ncbi:MAG: hypothetical protein SGCHY_003094 [Lobulomycetales sp.]
MSKDHGKISEVSTESLTNFGASASPAQVRRGRVLKPGGGSDAMQLSPRPQSASSTRLPGASRSKAKIPPYQTTTGSRVGAPNYPASVCSMVFFNADQVLCGPPSAFMPPPSHMVQVPPASGHGGGSWGTSSPANAASFAAMLYAGNGAPASASPRAASGPPAGRRAVLFPRPITPAAAVCDGDRTGQQAMPPFRHGLQFIRKKAQWVCDDGGVTVTEAISAGAARSLPATNGAAGSGALSRRATPYTRKMHTPRRK